MPVRSSTPSLTAQVRRVKEKDRPLCPSCKQHSPSRDSLEYNGIKWCRAFGHRCPHGEPCPGWSQHERTCTVCQ